MHLLHFLLDAAPAQGQKGGSSLLDPGMLLMIGGIALVFYFFMYKPQKNKQKEAETFQEGLVRGTKVVTIGGIIGKILEVRNKTFVIEAEGGTKLQVLKTHVSLESTKALNNEGKDEKNGDKKDDK
ncbi:MAG TPA: preprotein translocase subunit YajC [Bacteroidia bacterium]|nr:preprotein translocase subunit YajC [Bacteroidia bacterium]